MTNNFGNEVGAWVLKTKLRSDLVFKESCQRLIDEANLSEAKGGRMPVDTGFLRASGVAAVNSTPQGESKNEGKLPNNDVPGVLNSLTAGDTLSYGWTAEYAGIMNYKKGFMTVALQNWGKIVAKVTAEAKQRIR